jgi:hypothetical protein
MDKEGAVNMPCTPTNNPQRTLIAIHFRNQGGKMGFAVLSPTFELNKGSE